MLYDAICERCRDSKRFKREIEANSEAEAVIIATQILSAEPEDFYVISAHSKDETP